MLRTPWLSLLLLLAAGCSKSEDTGQDGVGSNSLGECGDPEAIQAYVVSGMSFTREIDGTLAGFDLDGIDSAAGDAAGCGHADNVSPDGTSGVDNAFAALVPVLESIGAGAVEGLIEDAINSGELLLLMELHALDAQDADECVDLTLYRGTGTPLIGTDGEMQIDQTFAVDTSRPSSSASDGAVAGGTFEIRDVEIALPVQILDEFLEFDLAGGAIRFTWNEDGTVSGELAGGVSVASLSTQIGNISDIGGLQDVVPPLIEGAADLWPDESGACTHLSIGFDFTARPAFVLVDE